MGVIRPTFNNFIYWYRKFKNGECTKDYARQQVCFAKTTWYYLCRDYERGEDVSKYFNSEVN
jgi:hypothetical protein